MGGEGSMAHANQSLKLNRSLLKKRNFRDRKDLMRSQSGKTIVEFDKIAPEELARIKSEIRLRAKKRQRKIIIVYIILGSITFGLLLLFIR